MLFNSLPFLVLVSVTFCLYYLPKLARVQVGILILASLAFYAYNRPALLLLLLASAGIVITTSYLVTRSQGKKRKLFATLGVVLNVSILIFFKYSGFAADVFNLSGSISTFLITLPLPLGISFYTFQGLTLLIDVYQNKLNPQAEGATTFKSYLAKSVLFITFFPQLISGPILKAHEFFPQIKTKLLRDIPWDSVFRSVVLGFFLKMVVADNLKDYTFWMDHPYFTVMPRSALIVMIFGYSIQLFADFAGYSLIAIGIARLFGYLVPDNFNFPYIATSFQDFWNRWHISLSTFFRRYLYFPLGGNRKGYLRTLLNILIVMAVSGLWHGAAWSYVIWGLFHGIMLVLERLGNGLPKFKANLVTITLQRIAVFVLVSIAWLLFKLPEFSSVLSYLEAIYTNAFRGSDEQRLQILRIVMYASPVVIYHGFYLLRDHPVLQRLKRLDYLLYGLLLFLILTNSGTAQAFIYFQF